MTKTPANKIPEQIPLFPTETDEPRELETPLQALSELPEKPKTVREEARQERPDWRDL